MNTHNFLKLSTISLCLFLAIALMFPTPVRAQGITIEDTVEKGEVVDHNLVLSGPVVKMDGKVEGDLVALGDTVTINGEVDGNLIAIGNKVVLNGPVSGSAYIGAVNLVVGPQASVGRDMSYIGGLFETKESSAITRDLNLLSLDANMSGTTGRDVNALIGPLRIGMVVYEFMKDQGWLPQTQSLNLQLSRSGMSMGFGLSSFQNFVTLSSSSGSILRAPEQQSSTDVEQWQNWGVALLRNLGALLIVGLLAIWLLPAQLRWTSEQPRRNPWKAFLIGLIVLTLGWFIALLFFVLVLGLAFFLFWVSLPNLGFLVGALGLLALGLAMVVYWLSIAYFSKVVVAFLVGRMLFARLLPKYSQTRVGPLLTGIIVYALLASIPYLGWVVAMLTTMFGLGALWVVGVGHEQPESELAPAIQPVEESLSTGVS